VRHALRLHDPNGIAWTALNERLVRRADHITVASSFLRRRFGGTLLPHGPDTSHFDPQRWPRNAALETLDLPDLRYLVFTGTPMPNKGLEDVLACLEHIARPDVRLLLVGSFAHDPGFGRRLMERFGAHLTLVDPRPHEQMPLFLAVASAVVLAQQPTRETEAQMPGKVYEAMAMARPVLATAVSDLPRILDGCGLLVPPGDTAALEEALLRLLDDPALGEQLGGAARKRCVKGLGWNAMERLLEADLARLARG
jgi:glycosyltransferase involved in cell wall biosynthesis